MVIPDDDDDAALAQLEQLRTRHDDPAADAALRAALEGHPSGRVRRVALHVLRGRRDAQTTAVVAGALARDVAPFVRRGAVEVLAERGAPMALVPALTDPIYRVRRQAIVALARAVVAGGIARAALEPALEAAIAAAPAHLHPVWRYRAEGALAWLDGLCGQPAAAPSSVAVAPAAAELDPDPAVVLEHVLHAAPEALAAAPEHLAALLALQDGYPVADVLDEARALAVTALQRHGSLDALLTALRDLDDPRLPDIERWCRRLLEGLPAATVDALRDRVDASAMPAAAALLSRLDAPGPQPSYWPRRAHSPLEPIARLPEPTPRTDHRRMLGGSEVSPLTISGRFGLPPAGFARALERGADTFFWEPEYTALTALSRSLPPARRARLRFVAGSFRGGADDVRRDLEAALRLLDVEHLTVFLLFWVRSPERLADDVLEMLVEACRKGWIGTFGISTHDRALAALALERGARVLMLRHNAAHRGAETSGLLDAIADAGADAIAFNCTSYGQLLAPLQDGAPPPATAPDAYRYCLSQTAVRTCLSAPRGLAELEENLAVLDHPTLDPEALEAMRARAAPLAMRNRDFARLVRWR